MEKPEFLKLLEIAGDDDKIKLRILYNAKVQNMKAYNAKYSQNNLKAWQAAEKALDDFADEVSYRAGAGDFKFDTLKAVIEFLKGKYPDVVQSTVYSHAKKGMIQAGTDGKYTLSVVEDYAKFYLAKLDYDPDKIDLDPEHEKRLAETKKAQAQAIHWDTKTKIMTGDYIEREAYERALAKRAAIFKSDLTNFARAEAGEICSILEGNAVKIPDLIEHLLERFEQFLDRYAADIEHDLPDKIDLKKLEGIAAND
jgi:hypothetical protein